MIPDLIKGRILGRLADRARGKRSPRARFFHDPVFLMIYPDRGAEHLLRGRADWLFWKIFPASDLRSLPEMTSFMRNHEGKGVAK